MTPFKRSLQILNSSLVLILATYILGVIYARLSYLNLKVLAIILTIPLKVFLSGGTLGMLVEVASGEEITLKFNRFTANAKKYWAYYFLAATVSLLTYWALTINHLNALSINLFLFFAHINPVLLFILSVAVIKDKYLKPLGLKSKPIPLKLPFIITTLALCTLSLVIYYLPDLLHTPGIELSRVTDFFYTYVYLLIFVFFACSSLEQYPEVHRRFNHTKEIYLINPLGGGILFHISSLLLRNYPPFFVVIKALTPKNYTFREFNRIPWKDHFYASGKLVAISCFSSNSSDAYQIARKFKEHGSKVILGGPHVTYLPDEALEYSDSVVCGELESVWPQIIKDYENDTLQKKYVGDPVDNCHELVYQELLSSPPAIVKDFLETSRGCKFKCHFCTVPSLSQGKLRKQSIDGFVELLKIVKKKYKHVVFIDNNIYSDPAYARELFKAIKPLNIQWSTQCTIDIAKNKETLQLAKDSGCKSFLIGFEISEGSFEKSHGGKLALVDHYREYAKIIKKMGIQIKAHFIFGFESDTFKHLYRFWKFCFLIKPNFTVLSILTPFPGSKFYYDAVQQDRISNLNWRHYGSQSLVYKHPRMNNYILAKVYPFIYLTFLLTTSKFGYCLLLFLIMSMSGII